MYYNLLITFSKNQHKPLCKQLYRQLYRQINMLAGADLWMPYALDRAMRYDDELICVPGPCNKVLIRYHWPKLHIRQ